MHDDHQPGGINRGQIPINWQIERDASLFESELTHMNEIIPCFEPLLYTLKYVHHHIRYIQIR